MTGEHYDESKAGSQESGEAQSVAGCSTRGLVTKAGFRDNGAAHSVIDYSKWDRLSIYSEEEEDAQEEMWEDDMANQEGSDAQSWDEIDYMEIDGEAWHRGAEELPCTIGGAAKNKMALLLLLLLLNPRKLVLHSQPLEQPISRR